MGPGDRSNGYSCPSCFRSVSLCFSSSEACGLAAASSGQARKLPCSRFVVFGQHLLAREEAKGPGGFEYCGAVLSLEAVVGASFCVALLAAAPAWAPALFCRWSVSVRADNLDDVHARVVATKTKTRPEPF